MKNGQILSWAEKPANGIPAEHKGEGGQVRGYLNNLRASLFTALEFYDTYTY